MSDTKEIMTEGSAHVERPTGIVENHWDTAVSTLALQDTTPWYRKPNLRRLYFLFIGSVLCVETTSGYDASVTNGLQSVPRWQACELDPEDTSLGRLMCFRL